MKKNLQLILVLIMIRVIETTAQAPNWFWASGAGGSSSDFGGSIAVDGSGNSYITGSFGSPTITFGSTTLTNASIAGDIFIAKYDASGNVLWAKRAGGTSGDGGRGIAVDGSGNCYVCGSFMGSTASFDTITLSNGTPGSSDVFIAKYSSSGNVIWAKSAGGTFTDFASSIATDASGNSYVSGQFASASITFGSTTLNGTMGSPGSNDIFIVKYDASGNVVWAKSAGGTGSESAISIAFDGGGNSYITGSSDSPSITFGSTTLTCSGYDIYIAKYDGSGNPLWAANASTGSGYDVAVDGGGNSFVCGSFTGSITFGSTTLTSSGNTDMFVAEYNSSGNPVWATSVGGSSYEAANAVIIDATGNMYVAGYFQSPSVTFGSTILTFLGGSDVFVAKYSSAGNVLWAKSAGGSGNDQVTGAAMDGSGYFTGTYYSPTISFGTTTLTNGGCGNADVYVAKLDNITGIEENIKNDGVSIYPNPVTNPQFTIQISKGIIATVEIYNVLGEKLYSAHPNTQYQTLRADFLSGIYFIQITTGKQSVTKKLIVYR